MFDRRAITVLIIAWLGWVFDVMDTALFNFAKGPMLTEMLGEATYRAEGAGIEGRIQALFLVGWALGGLGFGVLADRWGRARTLVLTVLMYSLLTGLTALCQTPDQVAILRFLTGLGIGGEWAAGATWVAETVMPDMRARAAGFIQTAAAFGPWLAAMFNLALPPGEWRGLFLVGVLPALLVVAVRWSHGHQESPREPRGAPFSELRELWAPPWRRRTLTAVALGIVGIAGAGILPFWLPNLVKQASANLGPEAVRNFTSYNTFTLHIGTLLGVLTFPLIAERIGRLRAFGLFFVLAPTFTALALLGGTSLERLLWLLPVAAFASIGLSAGFVMYFPELFPPHLRATGAGLAYNTGRIVAAPLPWLIGLIANANQGNVVAGILVASGIYVLGLLVLPFAIETKGQPLPSDT